MFCPRKTGKDDSHAPGDRRDYYRQDKTGQNRNGTEHADSRRQLSYRFRLRLIAVNVGWIDIFIIHDEKYSFIASESKLPEKTGQNTKFVAQYFIDSTGTVEV